MLEPTVRDKKSDNKTQINKMAPAVPWLLDAANPQGRDDGSL